MSEYWISKKKYFCKYCDIYIADDAPSRQHHENGLRHKGNVERFIRGIYKAGEKRKKDQEEEKREMVRVEQAAQAAFAQDVSLGHAKASSAPVASSSTAPRKPTARPSNPFANYSTAEQLGYTDLDAEMMQIRKSQGLVGEWQVVEPMHTQQQGGVEEEDVKPAVDPILGTDTTSSTDPNNKRTAEPHPDDDNRTFKLRKKTTAVGLGDIYDPGIIPIKLKKKEQTPPISEAPSSLTTSTPGSSNPKLPKWTAISLKGKESSTSKSETSDPSAQSTTEKLQPAASRWTKVQWSQPIKEEEAAAALSVQNTVAAGPTDKELAIKSEEGAPLAVKVEVDESSTPNEPEQRTAGLFKKRKTHAGLGHGRRSL